MNWPVVNLFMMILASWTIFFTSSANSIGTQQAVDEPASQPRPAPLAAAARQITVPAGFNVTLFAGEPDVRQPIAFTTDDRGRLWVVECYSYPNWMPGAVRGQDRIVIFEDQDGDGRFDNRTVFWDKGDNLTGIELGFGGVWLCATPNLIFIPDRDGDDRPDGEPQVVLDGWDPNCRHNAFNALNWGPDGWLYGCNGILSNSKVGRPGTPDADRLAMNCGVWRYHPTKQIFEAVAHGTTNPWGLDFDEFGEMFITNCVIPHLFHVVPGSHFQRMFGQDIHPHSYELMKSCADHIHWGGGDWTSSRGGQGIHNVAGGGHAHAGAMIYLGDNWPDRYRNAAFMVNIHGRRLNHDKIVRSGSGYVATHENDFLFSSDEWFRGLEMKYGPDGGVFLTDWSDTGECHDYDSVHGVHRDSGRIFKVTHGSPRPLRINLAKLSDAELVQLQFSKNDWHVRHARRLLQERTVAGREMKDVHRRLWETFAITGDAPQLLRAIWALHVTGGLSPEALTKLLEHENEHVRAWAVRLIVEDRRPLSQAASHNVLARFVSLAQQDQSPFVRMYLAAALQRIPLKQGWTIASGLVTQNEESADANLSLMIWYGIEPLVSSDRATAAALAGRCKIPTVRRFLARRIVLEPDQNATANDPPSGLASLFHVIKSTPDAPVQQDLLSGIHDALRGRKQVPMPASWPSVAGELADAADVREQALAIGLIFGDRRAAETLRKTMMNRATQPEVRQRAVQALVEGGVSDLVPQLRELLDEPPVRAAAIRALAAFDDPATSQLLVSHYETFSENERTDAIGTLAARPTTARTLLSAIEQGTIPRGDVSPFVARQIQAFGNREISESLARVWGSVRPTSADKSQLMAKYKETLTREELGKANLKNGRAIFNRTCAACHRLFGEGNDIGPDLTGSNRDNVDFILENVIDPNAVVGRDYKLAIVATKNGRVLSGIVRERFDRALVLQTTTERLTLANDDIEEMKESSLSMMPEGIIEQVTAEEFRDLVAYLSTKSQVALPTK